MKSIVIMGYHELSAIALEMALDMGFKVPLVVLNPPDRLPRVPWYRDLGDIARNRGIDTIAPENIRKDRTLYDILESISPDVVLSVNYHLIIPSKMLSIPEYGFWNFHDSLLPLYRGQAPSIFAMMNGEHYGGMTLHMMDEGIDTGPIFMQRRVPIGKTDLIHDLYLRVTEAGIDIWREFLKALKNENIKTHPQKGEGSYYRWNFDRDARIQPEDGIERCWNKYRALAHPFPGAFFEYSGRRFHILRAGYSKKKLDPGRIVVESRRRMLLGCGDGSLSVEILGVDGGWWSPEIFKMEYGLRYGEVMEI